MLCHETLAETAAISAHVSERIHTLYDQLLNCRDMLQQDRPVFVSITVGLQGFNTRPHCPHRRFHSRRLRLLDADKLPDLDFVHGLAFCSEVPMNAEHGFEDMRPISLLTPLYCLSHLPVAHSLELPWMWERAVLRALPDKDWQNDAIRPWEGPMRDARHEFGTALLSPDSYGIRIPESLCRAVLYFWRAREYAWEDQALPRPDLVTPALEDPVSLGLCKLAAQLEVLDLRALITPALFPIEGAAKETQWSRMRRLRIEFHPATPDGSWYFDGPADGRHNKWNTLDQKDENQVFAVGPEHYPRETAAPEIEARIHDVLSGREPRVSDASTDSHLFRVVPRRETVEPLLKAFAKALARDNMPCLENAEIFAWLWWFPRVDEELEDEESIEINFQAHRWGVKYIVPGVEEGDRREGVVQWQVGKWRPSADVLDKFEALGVRQEWLDLEVDRMRGYAPPPLS